MAARSPSPQLPLGDLFEALPAHLEGVTWARPKVEALELTGVTVCPDCGHRVDVHVLGRGCQAIDGEVLCHCKRERQGQSRLLRRIAA